MSPPAAYPLQLPSGSSSPLLTITRPSPVTWQIELHNGEDNRLTLDVIQNAFKPALDIVEREWRQSWRALQTKSKGVKNADEKDAVDGQGALVIVGKRGQDKFFSNGFDYQSVVSDPNWFPHTFDPLLLRLLTFPIPTVCAINGHCFAAGFIIALACDYRVMTDGAKRNAWICMNEVHFGAPWPTSFAYLLRAKISAMPTHRKIAQEGHRFTPSEALKAGIIDEVVPGGTEDVLSSALKMAEAKASTAKGGVWGLIKTEVYRDVIEGTKKEVRMVTLAMDDAAAKARL